MSIVTDIVADLDKRFEWALYNSLEAYEVLPDGRSIIRSDEDERAIDIFYGLRDTVQAIPPSLVKITEELYAGVGAARYEQFLRAAVRDAGFRSFINNATEFLEKFNMSLSTRPGVY